MNVLKTLRETETAIAGLSRADKAQLLKRLARDVGNVFHGIERSPGVMGGAACVRKTRIPVWMLYQARGLGVSEADLLHNYPGLVGEDLVNAWDYAAANRVEIESRIAENEQED